MCFDLFVVFEVVFIGGDFVDVDFGVEVGGECFVVVVVVVVYDVEVVDFGEVVFGEVCGYCLGCVGVEVVVE